MGNIEKQELLNDIKKRMSLDDSLPLRKGATNLVFGVGNSDAEILFIGEGPGYWEDMKAEPFVGNAGKFLDSLLSLIKISRKEVYITNVVHHRPPENRDPLPSEIQAYGRYLDEIIKVIDPKIIVTLGRFSMAKFLPNAKISSVHGRKFVVEWNNKYLTVVPMYHPAAGLRSEDVKQKIISDFKKLPAILEEVRNEPEVKKNEKGVKIKQMSLI